MKKLPRRAHRIIAGIRFISGGDGHYYSENKRYGLFHLFRGLPESCWEIHERDSRGEYRIHIGGETYLTILTHWANRGVFVLKDD